MLERIQNDPKAIFTNYFLITLILFFSHLHIKQSNLMKI